MGAQFFNGYILLIIAIDFLIALIYISKEKNQPLTTSHCHPSPMGNKSCCVTEQHPTDAYKSQID